MPWTPSATNRIDFSIDRFLEKILDGIYEGLDETGRIAFAEAKKHAPVRKVFKGLRAQGGGTRKGMRELTDIEVDAEAGDRAQLGLGPGRGVRTLGRPGTHPGRPRAAQNYQVDPHFGRVGMPNGEEPYNPNFNMRQQIRPEEQQRRLGRENRADELERKMQEKFGIVDRKANLITNQRELRQTDYSKAMGGQRISLREHYLHQPTRRVQRTPERHYIEVTGSLRAREHRDGLPHGAYGRYEPSVVGIGDAMTGRGRHESGFGISRGAQTAGRAVIMNPQTGKLQVGGRLKHAITYIPPNRGEPVMTARVDSPTYYTRYVEFGTRHAHAQPFLRPAVGHVRETMRATIKKRIAGKVRGR